MRDIKPYFIYFPKEGRSNYCTVDLSWCLVCSSRVVPSSSRVQSQASLVGYFGFDVELWLIGISFTSNNTPFSEPGDHLSEGRYPRPVSQKSTTSLIAGQVWFVLLPDNHLHGEPPVVVVTTIQELDKKHPGNGDLWLECPHQTSL